MALLPPPLVHVSSRLCDIVFRLLAKNAEDRFQCCADLRVALERCLSLVPSSSSPSEFLESSAFSPPVLRITSSPSPTTSGSSLQIHQKLYGRETEIAILTKKIDDFREGRMETILVLVHGYSGIG
jgi:serine/threonine protein kinase